MGVSQVLLDSQPCSEWCLLLLHIFVNTAYLAHAGIVTTECNVLSGHWSKISNVDGRQEAPIAK